MDKVNTSAYLNIVGRCTSGVKVDGYVVKSIIDGTTKILSKEYVEQLALSKQINNCTAQIYDGKVYMKGVNCKLSELPTYTLDGQPYIKSKKNNIRTQQTNNSTDIKWNTMRIRIVGRIVSGKSVIGYNVEIRTPQGITYERIEKGELLKLARDGHIDNARVQKFNNGLVLRGYECDLAKLPVIKE